MSEHSSTATRRTALALAIGIAGTAVTGCDLQDLDPREPLPVPGSDDSSAPQPPDPDADVTLVSEVVALVVARRSRVDAVRDRHRNLRREFAPLARMHQAHLEVLDPAGVAQGRVEAVTPATSKQAKDRRRLLQAERTLQLQIARAAERAEAGQVAKLLASISSSVAQHVAALEETSA